MLSATGGSGAAAGDSRPALGCPAFAAFRRRVPLGWHRAHLARCLTAVLGRLWWRWIGSVNQAAGASESLAWRLGARQSAGQDTRTERGAGDRETASRRT